MNFEQAWLDYKLKESAAGGKCRIFTCRQDAIMQNGIKELQMALKGVLGMESIVMMQQDAAAQKDGSDIFLIEMKALTSEAYSIEEKDGNICISASDSAGFLYGIFALIRHMKTQDNFNCINIRKEPVMPLRMLNHWDNMDGSIERGYSGDSFFFENNEIIINERTQTYARLLASVGINAVVINNVNVKDAATWLITDRYFQEMKELSEILSGYAIRLFISLNYAAPIELGELDSADPLDAQVQNWWNDRMKTLFEAVPNLGGFLIKADSEGRPGPFTYGRTHADGANMLARAAVPYGGLIIWRCFVYNCKQDWRDYKTDRARSGYDNFMGLDGQFLDNVILQIKNGPMDFQVREPVHPLFGGLTKTNQMLEVQIAQEYTGQQRHVCYLIPWFKEILEFRTYMREKDDSVCDIVSGKILGQRNCGIAAVANTGNDENWTGHDLAAANLYGFGRLAFEPSLTAEEIATEWISCTFGQERQVQETLLFLLMNSWLTYEKYTAPLGIGWMVNPSYHYGPSVDGYEYDRWGTYHRADHLGMGVDRSHNGTGYAGLYREPNASLYDNPETCPEELLLFFHHIPYDWKLKTGKTMIQHIYDTHFEGVEMVDEMVRRFGELEGKLPQKNFERIWKRLQHQKEHCREWRDQINSYFFRKSGIADKMARKVY